MIIQLLFLGLLCDAASAQSANGLSPVQAGLAEAREALADGDQGRAVEALQGLFDNGFFGVGVILADPALSTLAGNPGFDQLVDEMSRQAYPCEHDPAFAEFDFWVGDWDVHLANGTFAGTNRIRREQRGCVLIENWSGASGGSGTSINYVDKTDGRWVQVWNGAGGSQIHIRGGMTKNGMLLEGTLHYVATGQTLPFRGLWTPLEDGRVRQYFEQSNDGAESWAPWFEGFYTRRSGDQEDTGQ